MLKLKRVASGKYQTRDGRFDIWKDPLSGNDGGFVSWLIFEKGSDEPLHLSGSPHCRSLGHARELLEAHTSKAK